MSLQFQICYGLFGRSFFQSKEATLLTVNLGSGGNTNIYQQFAPSPLSILFEIRGFVRDRHMYQLSAVLSLVARQCLTVQSDSALTIGCRQAFIPYLVANHMVNCYL